VDTHVRVLGVLNIAVGVLGLIVAAVMMVGVGGAAGIISASADPDEAAIAVPILSVVGAFLVFFLFAFSLPSLAAGIGLLYFKPWARILGIVLSVIALLGFPWVTILGIYGLWVLFSKDTERLFSNAGSTV
jgi:protein-S-isoprenylcysteine O-methyltransferase Ste14